MASIDEGTIIQFNLKWFFGIVFSVITVFAGFYYSIQKPNNDSVKVHMNELMIREREYQNLRFEKLDDMSKKIDNLESTISALNRRNDDLNELRGNNRNTGASF